jgi:NAD(P)-dependent dehydrogenase (short-subunit alcohol dehydrogenase family)
VTAVLQQFRLDDRVCLVTGAVGGLGRAIADALASAGATVVLTSRDLGRAEAAAAELTEACGRPAHGLALDVRDPDSVEAALAETSRLLGGLDVLVNNAGLTHRGPLVTLTVEQWDEVLDTNLRGAWLCTRAAHGLLRTSGRGCVINVASMFDRVALPNRSPYVASKGGLAALTRALAVELASDGIRVNAISPGPFQTDMADASARADMLEAIPLRRWGEPVELGPVAVFLASDASSFITGATLAVDGGYTAR